jgi:hypothetical protein
MISVKVTYTMKSEFVPKNLVNIKSFLNDFKKMNEIDFRYTVYLCNDGKTFLHLSAYTNEEIQKRVLEVPSLRSFSSNGMKADSTALIRWKRWSWLVPHTRFSHKEQRR